jgi:hypothetical protein
MKCFYNHEQDAVGLCKSCGKGISSDYAVDLGKGLACKDRCEKDATDLIALIDSNIAMRGTSQKLINGSGRNGIVSSVILGMMGAVFLFTGLRSGSPEYFSVAIGVLFFAWGITGYLRSAALQRTIRDESKTTEN